MLQASRQIKISGDVTTCSLAQAQVRMACMFCAQRQAQPSSRELKGKLGGDSQVDGHAGDLAVLDLVVQEVFQVALQVQPAAGARLQRQQKLASGI